MPVDGKKGLPDCPKISSTSKFLLLLQTNRMKDDQRKQKIEQNRFRQTNSMARIALPQLMALSRPTSNETTHSQTYATSRTICLQKSPFDVPKENTLQLELNFKKLKDKFKMNSKRNCQIINAVVQSSVTSRAESPRARLLTGRNMFGRNLCDMFASVNSQEGKNGETNREQSAENQKKSRPSIPKIDRVATPTEATQAQLRRMQKVSSFERGDSAMSRLAPKPSKKSFSIASLRKTKVKKGVSKQISEKVNVADSAFMNQFCKIKKELFNSKITAVLNPTQIDIEMNTLVQKNYRSYWMMAIDELLAEDSIDVIQHGYYRYKQIGTGPFRLMTLVEQIKYRIEQDIARERFLISNAGKRRHGALHIDEDFS